ncbi:unnamed protein product, partial [Rotaria magnacalcarata]
IPIILGLACGFQVSILRRIFHSRLQ